MLRRLEQSHSTASRCPPQKSRFISATSLSEPRPRTTADIPSVTLRQAPTKSRRSFLKETVVGGALLGLSPRSHRAIFAAEPPSERVRVGMIGVGNQGGPKNNMKYFLNNIVALCDLDTNYLAEAGEFLQKQANLSAVMTDDYRRLLDAKDLDAVVVTVPDQWHALMTIEACAAGKDVYCEKPL